MSVELPPFPFDGRAGVLGLVVMQVAAHCGGQQALLVHAPEAPGGILFRESLPHHGIADLVGHSNTCRTGSEDDYPLVAERGPADAHGGNCRRQRDRAGALHIVVEDADPVAVLLEYSPSIARSEALPLQ